ncbi:MAG: N-acetylmuramoyl-L-alanine amidase [Acaryochloridaceae cyanobacterium SU_2_1]|nr:N-acetylmuramoyl-L-alanine amidase [Acaryochloridaceae cyanobacterium SU_2_1]
MPLTEPFGHAPSTSKTINTTTKCNNTSRTKPEDISEQNAALLKYQPKQITKLADVSNYGDRVNVDGFGKPVSNEPLVVLHETVISASETVRKFQTPHPSDGDQASYHALVTLDGVIISLVPWEKRAFGAGNSAFTNSNKVIETVQTNPNIPPSVNNFAYHVSLETPIEGRNDNKAHIGYTEAEYRSLAWLLGKANIPESRITTHREIDRSGTRTDPRSFDYQKLFQLMRAYKMALELPANSC